MKFLWCGGKKDIPNWPHCFFLLTTNLSVARLYTLVSFLLMGLVSVTDKLFSRKCSPIISLVKHTYKQSKRERKRERDAGRRLRVSDGGEGSNPALSFSLLLSCGDLKEVSDREKLSVVSSFLINSHIQFLHLLPSPG